MTVMDSPRHWSVERWTVCLAFAVLLALRASFLPASLDGLDSVNFDLGTHDFDPLAHRPHPPGYPLFIVAAKLGHLLLESHGAALALVSAVFGAALVVPVWVLMRQLARPGAALLATALVLFNPLVWFTSVRPMSDAMGLAAVLATQALLVTALLMRDQSASRAARLWNWGALAAGIALGVRVQTAVLVGPLLLYGWWRWPTVRVSTVLLGATGVVVWLVPVVVLSDGPVALVRSFIELVNDALPVEPLLSNVTVDRARWAAHDVLLASWGRTWLAVPIVSLAAIGALALAWDDRKRLLLIALLFVPYTVYHYLLQMTEVVRYAIPVVPLVAVLAVEPIVRWRVRIGVPPPAAATAFVIVASVITVPALWSYRSSPSPVWQAIAHVRDVAGDGTGHLVSGNFVFNRYLDELPPHVRVIEPRPRADWQQLIEYWKGGGREPVLFLRDARRTALALIGRGSVTSLAEWRWPAPVQPFLKGSRPAWIELVRIDPPRWFVESGFLLSEEAGPIERVSREPHRLHVDAARDPQALIVSGRVIGREAADLSLSVGERTSDRWQVSGQFTVRAELDAVGREEGYVPVTLLATKPVLLTDLMIPPADRGTVRPATGFYLPERDEHAAMFRWMGPEASVTVVVKDQPVRLRLRGQVPVDYFRLPVTVSLALEDRVVGSFDIQSREFDVAQDLPRDVVNRQSTLTVTVSHRFVPDEFERNDDRRQLSLRIYELTLEPLATAVGSEQQ